MLELIIPGRCTQRNLLFTCCTTRTIYLELATDGVVFDVYGYLKLEEGYRNDGRQYEDVKGCSESYMKGVLYTSVLRDYLSTNELPGG